MKHSKEPFGDSHINRISPLSNSLFNVLFIVLTAAAIFPLFFVLMISISDEQSLLRDGYRFIPQAFSTAAYQFLWNERAVIFSAFKMSVIVTVVGTALGVIVTTMLGYTLSRPYFKLKKLYTWLVFVPMIFNGGMVANYVVVVNLLQLNNTAWSMILPLAVSSFHVIICKTFFRSTIPDSIIESAKIDGATQLGIFSRIVMPISKPVVATIALFLTFTYWNDWFLPSLYISDKNLVTLQALLNNMMQAINYILNNPSGGLSMQQYRNSLPSESVRMAIAIVIVIPIACAYPFFQKYFISGLTIGAVKG